MMMMNGQQLLTIFLRGGEWVDMGGEGGRGEEVGWIWERRVNGWKWGERAGMHMVIER